METKVLSWLNPAPLSQPYPWLNLEVPEVLSNEEAGCVCAAVKERGDESFEKGDYYDALWKYEHACRLAGNHLSLANSIPSVQCSAAMSCLKLGDSNCGSLIEHKDSAYWYYFGYQHADAALSLSPTAEVACKAYRGRGECLLRMQEVEPTNETKCLIEGILKNLPPNAVMRDFVTCFELDPENVCSLFAAILEATKTGQISSLPTLTDQYAKMNVGTELLKEIVSSSITSSIHLRCLLMEMTTEESSVEHFKASELNPLLLLDKEVYDIDLYQKLVGYGMHVTPLCLAKAVEVLSEENFDLFKFFLSECIDKEYYSAQELCVSSHKAAFLDAIELKISETFQELKESGDASLASGAHLEALTKYQLAIEFCQKHDKKEENATVQVCCAQACVNLRRYTDAYEHSTMCINLNPLNYKGYYQRAEALMSSIQLFLTDSLGSYGDVVKDYLKCHGLHADIDVFCKAIVVAVNNGCCEVIPKLSTSSMSKDFSNQILLNIEEKHQITEPILEFVLLDLPDDKDACIYDASGFSFCNLIYVTTRLEIFKRLFLQCGMPINDSDIVEAIFVIDTADNNDVSLLEFLIQNCEKTESFQKYLDEACVEAMSEEETDLVMLLIKHGSRPFPRDFMDYAGLNIRRTIMDRLFSYDMINPFRFGIWNMMASFAAKERIEDLRSRAKMDVRLGFMKSAENHYILALKTCEDFQLEDTALVVHKDLARLYLQMDKFRDAYIHSRYLITLSADDSTGYIYCAKAVRKGMEKGKFSLSTPILDNYHVISAYQVAYDIDSNLDHLVEALLVASKNGDMVNAVSKECSKLDNHECLKLLQELVKRDCNSDGFNFLMNLWKDTKTIKYSALSMKGILAMKDSPNENLITQLISHGIKVNGQVLTSAIQHLPNDRLNILKLLEEKCGEVDIDFMCQAALKARKISFVVYFITSGAKWPKHQVEILRELWKEDLLSEFEVILKLLMHNMIREIDIVHFISAKPSSHIYIGLLLNAGVNPDGKRSSIMAVKCLKIDMDIKFDLITRLIQKGADCNKLCDKKTTPLHVATEMAIESNGKTEIIQAVASSPYFNRYQIVDGRRETPIHIAINPSIDAEVSLKVLTVVLQLGFVNPTIANVSGKKCIDLVKSDDPRALLINDYIMKWEKQFTDHNKNQALPLSLKSEPSTHEESFRVEQAPPAIEVQPYRGWVLDKKLKFHLDRIAKENEDKTSNLVKSNTGSCNAYSPSNTDKPLNLHSEISSVFSNQSASEDEWVKNPEGMPNLDNLPWEVEITKKVITFFQNVSHAERIKVFKVLCLLAEGNHCKYLSKVITNNPNICLYEAQISPGGKFLLQIAISFSTRTTTHSQFPVYAQVIRVWDVVLDQEEFNKSIHYCVSETETCIEYSYNADYLLQIPDDIKNKVHDGSLEYPDYFTLRSDLSDHQLIPAFSSDHGLKVATFYSFDSKTARSLIMTSNERSEYPFKEWQEEYKIIRITINEPLILVGGRSTGKTTCCLYRLWNEFISYWDPASVTYRCALPQKSRGASSKESSNDTPEFQELIHENYPNGDKITENLHQVFITKNKHLGDQVKKTFYNMAATYDFLNDHLSFEESAIPNSFSKFKKLSFPAFLSARQFYIILDNSLEDGNHFFKRDDDGNLQAKIVSLDYEHDDQDMLWELIEKSCEGEVVELLRCTSKQSKRSKKYAEVTAVYFKEVIWPEISNQCKVEAAIDPMLVWLEIQHFIKGSILVMMKGSPLTLEEYKDVDKRMAHNFSENRELIYMLYVRYQQYIQNKRHSYYLFDECDLILDIHQRLKMAKDVSWSIHSMYVDGIQDFTLGELAILIGCCKDPNSIFFTGDTGQNREFQLYNVQTFFHQLHQSIPGVKIPSKLFELTVNYQSYCGVLKLAGSIGDLIKEQDSTECLPANNGLLQGPTPIFLYSCKEDDLLLALSANGPELSMIDFGAHQVVLMQSKAAKEKLPQFLKNAIVLTISEAKGMQFDDVLIYNFFTDSMVDMKVWQHVTSFPEMSQHTAGTDSQDKVFNVIDTAQGKSFNMELKCLHSAITCAKRHLWIYDSGVNARFPVLEYLQKREVIKILTSDIISTSKESIVFASKSTPAQWKEQGDCFRRKHLWEQAILCYKKAGPDCLYLVKETEGFNLIMACCLSNDQKKKELQEAAVSFLESDSLKHSLKCIRIAALCLVDSKLPMYLKVAKLLECLGDFDKAAQVCLKNRDYDNFARIQEDRGEYESVIQSLYGKIFKKKKAALMKARNYESKGYTIDPQYATEQLSFTCAKFYLSVGDNQTLLEVLKYMPEAEKRLKFLKRAKLYEEAYEDYLSIRHMSGAYKLALGQGWLRKAIDLAKTEGDEVCLAQFTLLEAKSYYCKKWKEISQAVADKKIISKLKKLTEIDNGVVNAEANLLLGMLQQSQEHCTMALEIYNYENHKAGILESFELLKEVSNQEILNYCHLAMKLGRILREASDLSIDVQQTMKFYGLQFVGKAYLTTQYGHCFAKFECIQKYQCEDVPTDLDGMIRLRPEIREMLAQRFEDFARVWITRYNLESSLYSKCQSFILHSELWKNRHLTRQYTHDEVSVEVMLEYILNCLCVLEFKLLDNQKIEGMLTHFEVIFSPHVSMCLLCLNSRHVHVIRQSVNSLIGFKRKIESDLVHLCQKEPKDIEIPEKILIDPWLNVWRLSSISCPNMKFLLAKLEEKEKQVNKEQQEFNEPGFIFWKTEKRYLHIFHFWLTSCFEIRNSKALWGVKMAIIHFLGNIIESKRVSISIWNIVNILTIHCTALLAMIIHANNSTKLQFTIPHTYKHVVEIFDSMNCSGKLDYRLFSACAEEAASHSNYQKLIGECKNLLNRALSYLIGTYERAPKYSVLRFALHKYRDTDQTLQCLILTLTMFGNLSMIQSDVRRYERKLTKIFLELESKCKNIPVYVQNILVALKSINGISKPHTVFKLVEECLTYSQKDAALCTMVFSEHLGDIVITRVKEASQVSCIPIDYDIFQTEYDQSFDEDSHPNFCPVERDQSIDPSLITDDIIDHDSNFCVPCGVHFIHDDMITRTKQPLELWSAHVTGSAHTKLSRALNLFLSSLEKDCLIKAAKEKLQEFNLLKLTIETDQLDYAFDNLEDEIHKYHLIVAEVKERRNWREGLNTLAQSEERLDRVLKKADDQIHEYRQVQQKGENQGEKDKTKSMSEVDLNRDMNHETIQTVQSKKKYKKKKRKGKEF